MFWRFRSAIKRKISLIFKSVPLIIGVTFIWLYLRLNNYDINSENTTSNAVIVEPNNSTHRIESLTVSEIRKRVDTINRMQTIANSDKFSALVDQQMVIVIQVHDRAQYLQSLVKSLQRVKYIETVLLVFSHDVYDHQINSIVNSINFCKVIQIYFPYSLQLNAHTFPGQSANDCPRDMKKEEAIKTNCTNAKYADSYGHYREAKYAQTKHHWWWKVNHVMDRLDATRNHSGYFMFLEEDHYLSSDVLHVWQLMNLFRKENCNKCDVITLGVYTKTVNFAKNGNKVQITKWFSSRHNMGFVIDRKIWNLMKSCAEKFCTYDDYNWDWSLQWLSDTCLPSPLITLVVSTPRVFHIGECGVHHKGKDCSSYEIVHNVDNVLNSAVNDLFPSQLDLENVNQKVFKRSKVNGGWSDIRDHQLCMKQIESTI